MQVEQRRKRVFALARRDSLFVCEHTARVRSSAVNNTAKSRPPGEHTVKLNKVQTPVIDEEGRQRVVIDGRAGVRCVHADPVRGPVASLPGPGCGRAAAPVTATRPPATRAHPSVAAPRSPTHVQAGVAEGATTGRTPDMDVDVVSYQDSRFFTPLIFLPPRSKLAA